MAALIGVILGTFRAQNRNTAINRVSENGTWIINELRKNVFNGSGDSVFCADDSLSVQIKNLQDGGITTLSCDLVNSKIASTSATKQDNLNNKGVEVVDCTDFVTCESVSDGNVMGLYFKFGLKAVVNGVGTSQIFSTKVTLRN